MGTVNYVRMIFCIFSWMVIMMASLVNTLENYLPVCIRQMFRYGKYSYSGNRVSRIKLIEVPKAWFKHFYVFSSMALLLTSLIVISVYIFKLTPAVWLIDILDVIGGSLRTATVSQMHVLLATTLMTVQCFRRFHDTQRVSVFSKTAKMNLSYYIIGFTHYAGVPLAILVEAPIFSPSETPTELNIFDLKISDYLATILFLWAWLHQYNCTVILANLRKNPKGTIVTQEYKLPKGDWFNYVSSPHSTAEILMYFSIAIILRGNFTWVTLFCWVLVNQVETTLLSHWWYQETFKDFPTDRKAIIPYIY